MNMDERLVGRISCLVVGAVFLAGLMQLAFRLKEIQVDETADYSYASTRQSMRRVRLSGGRGRILDRHCRPLAENRMAVSIVCQPACFQKRTWSGTLLEIKKAIDAVSAVIRLRSSLTDQDIRRHLNQTLAMPLVVWRDLDERELAVFAEHERDFPGFSIVETNERTYPCATLASHLIGYVGRDSDEADPGDVKFSFVIPEMRGRSGLELYYDSFLRGVPGESRLLVDARGFAIEELSVAEPSQGPDLRLSIDIDIQTAVERELAGLQGACVVINPQTGEVLAMASAPDFNPNDFVPVLKRELYQRYAHDRGKPLLNRAAGGAYAPGSTFKPITALAGLSSGYSAYKTHCCNGFFQMGRMNLHCASRWGHGDLDMCHALMKSCNPYFCNLGMTVGTNALITTARAFGLGAKTRLDLGVDMAGTVPDGEWKQRMYGERWFPGDLAQMSIGQGMLLVSPLQMAIVAGAIGTGFVVTPHLKSGIPVERRRLPFSKAQLDVVREGMRMVVAGDGSSKGPGWRGGDGVGVSVSGKTGTAEVGRGATRRKNTWFIAYAPSDNPRVAISMVVENGESGGLTTAPKVSDILKFIFNGPKS